MLLLLPPVLYLSLLLLILYYLHQLKNNKACNELDNNNVWNWRHNTLYILTIYQILFIFFIPIIILLLVKYKYVISVNVKILLSLIYLSIISIYVYALFSYVSINNNKNLDCLKRGTLNIVHRFLNTWRYMYILLFINIVISLVILYYIHNFNHKDCECHKPIHNWLHNTIYVLTIIYIIHIILMLIIRRYRELLELVANIIVLMHIVFGFVYSYNLFTYISLYNNKKCKCIVNDETLNKLHKSLYNWRYTIIVTFILSLVIVSIYILQKLIVKDIIFNLR
jgi:hypothetical protein